MKHKIEKTKDLTNLPIGSTFSKYVILNTLSMFGVSLLILSDTLFVSNGVGADGIAALGLVIPMINIINGIGWMLGTGGATIFSIAKGKGDIERAQEIYTMTLVFTAVISLLFLIAVVVFVNPILGFLGAEGTIFNLARPYFLIVIGSGPLFIFVNVIVSFIRNDDNPNLGMIAVLGGALINVVIDYVLVIVFDMGLIGAGIGTIISPILSLLAFTLHMRQEDRVIGLRKFKFDIREFTHILSLGFSSFINEFAAAVETFLFNTVILGLAGNIGVSAYSILANLNIVVIAVFTGIGQGFQPLVSTFYGAKKIVKLRRVLYLALVVSTMFGIFTYTVAFVWPNFFASIFNSQGNATLQQIVVDALPIYFINYFVLGISYTGIYFMAGVDRARASMIISALRGFILVIPLLLMFSEIWGLTGVWATMPAVDIITASIAAFLLYDYIHKIAIPRAERKRNRMERAEKESATKNV